MPRSRPRTPIILSAQVAGSGQSQMATNGRNPLAAETRRQSALPRVIFCMTFRQTSVMAKAISVRLEPSDRAVQEGPVGPH